MKKLLTLFLICCATVAQAAPPVVLQSLYTRLRENFINSTCETTAIPGTYRRILMRGGTWLEVEGNWTMHNDGYHTADGGWCGDQVGGGGGAVDNQIEVYIDDVIQYETNTTVTHVRGSVSYTGATSVRVGPLSAGWHTVELKSFCLCGQAQILPLIEINDEHLTMKISEVDLGDWLSPINFRNLAAWYKADTATIIPGTSRVATWPDMSGNGRNLQQNTSALQPTAIANGIQGRRVLRFSPGSHTRMSFPADFAQSIQWRIFVVGNFRTQTGDATIVEGSAASLFKGVTGHDNKPTMLNGSVASSTAYTGTHLYSFAATNSPNTVTMRVDDHDAESFEVGGVTGLWGILGSATSSPDMDVAEIFIFQSDSTGTIAETDERWLWDYLNTKYGFAFTYAIPGN